MIVFMIMGPFSHSIGIALLYSFTSGFTHHRRRNLSVVSFLELSHKKYKLIFHKKKLHYLYFIAFYLQSVIAALQLSLSSRNFGFRLSPDDIWWLDPGGLDESLTKCAVLGVGCRRGSPHPHLLIQCEGSLGWDTVFAKYSSSCGKLLWTCSGKFVTFLICISTLCWLWDLLALDALRPL